MAEINIKHWLPVDRHVIYSLDKGVEVIGVLTRLYDDGTADIVTITERFTGGTWDVHEKSFGTGIDQYYFVKEPADFRELLKWDAPKPKEEIATAAEVFHDSPGEQLPVRKKAVQATRLR